MDSNSNNIFSFSPDKTETLKHIDCVEFAKTIDNAYAYADYNSIPVTQPTIKYPDIMDFDTFEEIKIAVDTAATCDEQSKFSYVLPLVFDELTQRYKLPDYAEDLYNYKMNELTGKSIPSFNVFDFSKTKLFENRQQLQFKLRPLPLAFNFPTPPHINVEKYVESSLKASLSRH